MTSINPYLLNALQSAQQGFIRRGPEAGQITPTTLTVSSNITLNDSFGGVISNSGAAGAVVANLQRAVPGMRITAIKIANQNFDLNPDANDTIFPICDAGGDALRITAVGDMVTLACVQEDQWVLVDSIGTPTDVN